MGTTTIQRPTAAQPDLHQESATESGWMVVLHNDDVTPFEIVIYALQRAAGLSLEVAEMVAVEAHDEQCAIVKRGLSEEDALIMCGGLRKWSRVDGVCPGLTCEAVHDE